jgi:hypothetical protein
MDPSRLIPVPDPIPVPWGWFQFLLMLTFVLHLLFMNTMLGTGIIAVFYHLKRPETEPTPAKDISRQLPYTIAFTVNMGVAPLLFMQVIYGHFFYVSSVLMAVYWMSVIGLLIIAYYSAYIYDFKYEALGASRALFICTTVLILLFIGFLFTNNLTLMLHPETWNAYFETRGGTLLNLSDSTLIPRYLHFVTASIAVGGLFIAVQAGFDRRKTDEERGARINAGMGWFSYATVAQIIVGLWFLMALPTEIMLLFMGKSLSATMIFLAGLAGTLFSLVFGFRKRPVPAAISVMATVVFMVLMRDLVRRAYLDPYFSVSSLKVIPQYSPLVLFLCSLVIGLAVVWFILKSALKTGKGA